MRCALLTLALLTIWLHGASPARADLIGTPQLPPGAKISVPPNVLLILDHSGSMGSGPGSRWEKAKATLRGILQTYGDQGIRFGLMRMDGSNHDGTDQPVDGLAVIRQGGRILRPCGTPAQEIIAYLDAWTASNQPQTWTNLAETLADAGRYFATTRAENGERSGQGPPGFGAYDKVYAADYAGHRFAATSHDDRGTAVDTTSPIQLACQKNFVVFITDGTATYDNDWPLVTDLINGRSPTGDLDVGDRFHDREQPGNGCPAAGCTYFDDVAAYLYASDLRADLGTDGFETQNVTTHVIGFEEDHPLLAAAAAQGHGLYLNANASDESLHEALVAVLEDIRREVAAGTAGAVVTQSTTQRDLLRSVFYPREQTGDLQAFSLPLPDPLPADFYAQPRWSAAGRLAARDPDSRRLFTAIAAHGTLRKEVFNELARAHLAGVWNLSAAATTARMDAIRARPLGTIIHATPVVIGPPRFHHREKSYPAFRQRWKSRPTLIYTGANDGMLHAFYAAGSSDFPSHAAGDEAWAYIPARIQAALKATPGATHRYLVDLPPTANDVWDRSWDLHEDDAGTGDGDGWRTVLIGSGRLGTEAYFALDVTDPSAGGFDVLWEEIPHPGARASTRPLLGALESPSGGESAAVFTAGYREDAGPGGICALRVSDGSRLAIWQADGPAPAAYLEVPGKDPGQAYYTMSAPVGFDADGNGLIDVIYAGDSDGVLWKFYYDFVAGIWKKNACFATPGQPITGRPTLVPDRRGNLRVYFGTGKYLIDRDAASTVRNAFYCLIEKPHKTPADEPADANEGRFVWAPPRPAGPADLFDITALQSEQAMENLGEEEHRTLERAGWFFALDAQQGRPAERVITRPQVLAGVVFFTSFTPSADPCSFGGSSRLYAVTWDSGLQARLDSIETVLKKDDGSNLPAGKRYGELAATGAARFLWDAGSAKGSAGSQLLLQTGGGAVESRDIHLPGRRMSLLGWREIHH